MTAERSIGDGNEAVPSAGVPRGQWTSDGDLDPQWIVSAALAVSHSPDQVHCGISVSSPDRAPETLGATDDLPVRVDWLQHELRHGPGVDPAHGTLVVSRDLAADQRWLDFGKLCFAVLNLRSMVSVRVPIPGPDWARLNFYGTEPTALDDLDVAAARKLARLAVPSVTNVLRRLREAPLEAGQPAHSSLAIALGTLMGRYRVNSARAFDLLLQASHDLDRSLVDVAADVVHTGRLPDPAVNRRRHDRQEDNPRGPGGTSLPATQAWVRNGAIQAWVERRPGVARSNAGESQALLSDAGPVPGVP